MSEREQFEAAMRKLAEQPETAFERPYANDDINAHWAVWQASRRTALEHSADVIANVVAHGGDLNAAVALIRELSKEPA